MKFCISNCQECRPACPPQKPASDASDKPFDEEAYRKLLENILKAAQDEYKQVCSLPGEQRVILRNYQWLATVIIAAQGAMFGHIVTGQGFWPFPWHVVPTSMFYVWAVLAVVCSLAVFVLGLDTLRGRMETAFPYKRTYKDFMTIAHDEIRTARGVGSLYATMVQDLQIAIDHQREKVRPTGPKLRKMSWALLLSLLFTFLALLPNIILLAANQAQ